MPGSLQQTLLIMAACRRSLLSIRCFSPPVRLLTDGDPTKFQPPPKPVIVDKTKQGSQRRYLSPEFVPPRTRKDPFKYFLERRDMIQRRKVFNIPEFYVGSILAVSMSDPHANGKINRFVGICIERGGSGLGATFALRNVIEGQGVEMRYELYNPRILEIQVLKLEKRVDDNLMYLRDALPEYSTFDFNMKPVTRLSEEDIPVNQLKVKMKPRPWSKKWERPQYNVRGIMFELYLHENHVKKANKLARPWAQFDMMKEYDTKEIEQNILKEVEQELKQSEKQ
ncbi:39S ribosomal L19, mitochondrial [Pelobates cultripes]|uniref:Large ribosomal subunit protein bL19m n=1 Tax=Pelobates cultripes TaxID=61616 RepID=A0AAD1R9Q1_PELCU|nr:39S ribosomal L19, mitochondrial [Pelobates cultripes]CAH2245740.1 39S ribosomal L19, mitochondrial [Pelobates cultripes]